MALIGERRSGKRAESKGWLNDPHDKKMSLIGLILMILLCFCFANSPSAFYLMGYKAQLRGIYFQSCCFIPFAFNDG